jgi:two-component system sensor histidine kinase AtoS
MPDAGPTDSRELERLSALGRIAEGLGGDLRQSLSVIRNSIYFLNLQLGETKDDKTRRHLGIMLREVRNAARTVTNLSSLALHRPPDRRPVDVELLVAAALGQVLVPPNVSVETTIPTHVHLFCDPEQVACAVANVVANSVQAMPAGGRVRISCRTEPGATIVEVTDSGCGMTRDTLNRAFEPLFSTAPYRAGLGLPVVRTLVGANGGVAAIDSTPGQGTTVALRFYSPDHAGQKAAR